MALHSETRSTHPALSLSGPARLRLALLVACLAAVTVGYVAGDPAPALRADPDLTRLLRGMAALKALMVLGAFAVVWWRLGHAVSLLAGAGYVAALAAMSAGAALIWQLSFIGPTAFGFHAALIALFVVAMRDGGFGRAITRAPVDSG